MPWFIYILLFICATEAADAEWAEYRGTTCGCDTFSNVVFNREYNTNVNFLMNQEGPSHCLSVCVVNKDKCTYMEYNKYLKHCYFCTNTKNGAVPAYTQTTDCYELKENIQLKGRGLMARYDREDTPGFNHLMIITVAMFGMIYVLSNSCSYVSTQRR